MHISKETLHIAVAEPSYIIRRGVMAALREMVKSNLHIVEITTYDSLEKCMKMHSPDLLIFNPTLMQQKSEIDNNETLNPFAKMRLEYPTVKYIELVAAQNEGSSTCGGVCRITLDDRPQTILSTIEELLGTTTIAVEEKADEEQVDILSQREKEIVVGVVNGLTNKEIADKLFLSVHTVITHRKNIAKKLQIHSVAALTIYAIANRLVDLNN